MVEAIKIAAEKYPEGELTGPQIREGLESLEDLDLGGLGANVSIKRRITMQVLK